MREKLGYGADKQCIPKIVPAFTYLKLFYEMV